MSCGFFKVLEAQTVCNTSTEIQARLSALPEPADRTVPYEQRMGPLRRLADQFPNDIVVQLRYQDAFRQKHWLIDEFDHALSLYRAQDKESTFLRARLLMMSRPVESRKTLDALLKANPDFAWPHLAIAEMLDRMPDSDGAEITIHARAFLNACPDSMDGLAALTRVQDVEFVRQSAHRLRAQLKEQSSSPKMWSTLWKLEIQAQNEGWHTQVLKDVETLKSQFQPVSAWLQLFAEAAHFVGDDAPRIWAESAVLQRAPKSPLALEIQGGRADALQTAATNPFDHQTRLRMMRGYHSGVPLSERLAVADAVLKSWHDFPEYGGPPSLLVAEKYLDWGVRLDQVEPLLQQLTKSERYRIDPAYLPLAHRKLIADDDGRDQLRARLFIATHTLDAAQQVIDQGLAKTARMPPSRDTADPRPNMARLVWVDLEGQLAAANNHVDQALARFKQRLLAFPTPTIREYDTNDTVARIRDYYLQHGGSESSWAAWAGGADVRTFRARPLQFNDDVARFEVKDLNGRAWSTATLEGKITLVEIWATWCLPCQDKNRMVQAVADRIGQRDDIQVLTFSQDDQPAVVEKFLKDKAFTFPVVVSRQLSDQLFPVYGLPSTFVVDKTGQRLSRMPLDGPEEIVQTLEQLAAR